MIKTCLVICVFLIQPWNLCHSATHAERLLKLPHAVKRLKNGLTIYIVKYPSPGVVAYQIPVRVGSRNETEPGKTGFAHFFEHLMFRGTKNRTGEQFSRLYNELGCENNAWTSNDMTNYHGIVARHYLPQILEAEADRFMNLSFSEALFKDEAGAVSGEYNKNAAQPDLPLEEALAAAAFKVHPYGHTTLGYKSDIDHYRERYKDVWPFFASYYRPENTRVVLVGDVDLKKHLLMVEKYFKNWKPATAAVPVIDQEPPQTEIRTNHVKIEKPTQRRIVIAYRVPGFSTKKLDHSILDLISEISFSVTSEFQKEYRYGRKWVDSVDVSYTESIDPSLYSISLRLSEAGNQKTTELIAALDQVIVDLSLNGVDAKRLMLAKMRIRSSATVHWFSSPESLAGRIAWFTNFENDIGVLDRVFADIRAVKNSDIMHFVKVHFIPQAKTIVTLEGSGS